MFGENPPLYRCNQQLCNAVRAREKAIRSSPASGYFGWTEEQTREIAADVEIEVYFTYVIHQADACSH